MKIKVPTSWVDVTLEQYMQLSEVPSLGFDEMDSNLKILSILTGIQDDVFLTFTTSDLKVLFSKIKFVNQIPKGKLITKIKVNGNYYSLNILPSTLTAGEYIDLSEFTKVKADINKKLPKILSVIARPVNRFGFRKRNCYKKVEGRYIQTIESREQTEKDMLGVTMDVVFPLTDFFFRLYSNLTATTLHYLEAKEKKLKKEIQKDLHKIGVGFLR